VANKYEAFKLEIIQNKIPINDPLSCSVINKALSQAASANEELKDDSDKTFTMFTQPDEIASFRNDASSNNLRGTEVEVIQSSRQQRPITGIANINFATHSSNKTVFKKRSNLADVNSSILYMMKPRLIERHRHHHQQQLEYAQITEVSAPFTPS
jgi:hypothetical protein